MKDVAYRYRKNKAQPKWLSEEHKQQIREIYRRCKQISEETGVPHHVDHIIPIKGKNVSGLHVPQNLQIVTASYNMSKKNKVQAEAAAE